MLPRTHRLRLTTEFERIKKQGRMVNGPLFGLLVSEQSNNLPCRQAGQQPSRFGFVVSTKIDKRAVVRHRIKRLLSEAVRLNLDKMKPGYEIVFLAKKSLVGKSFTQVKDEVEKQFQRLGLIN